MNNDDPEVLLLLLFPEIVDEEFCCCPASLRGRITSRQVEKAFCAKYNSQSSISGDDDEEVVDPLLAPTDEIFGATSTSEQILLFSAYRIWMVDGRPTREEMMLP